MLIQTTLGDLDDSMLQMIQVTVDNANERTTTTEYCVIGCLGQAHVRRTADTAEYFCAKHVHRSGHCALKTSVMALSAVESLR